MKKIEYSKFGGGALSFEVLKAHDLFKMWEENDLKELYNLFKIEKYFKNQPIITEGSKGSSFYIIKKGAVKVVKKAVVNEKIITVLYEGECFGELSLIDDKPRSASVIPLEYTEVYVLTHSDFMNMLKYNFNSTLNVLKYLTDRVRKGNEALISFMYNSGSQRLIDYIKKNGVRQDHLIKIKGRMNIHELANVCNCEEEIIYRLQNLGIIFIDYEGKICLDTEKLSKQNS